MASNKYTKLGEAPESFMPEVEVDAEFEADYTAEQERSLIAAGWIDEAAAPAKTTKGKGE